MKLVLSALATALVMGTLAAAVPSANAMDKMMMHHKKGHHMMMHMSKCKGEFMMMDKKSHKCMDARS